MAWVKIDDRYAETRKMRRAWRRDEGAVALHVFAMTHCALHETDGLVELDWLEERMPDEQKLKERLALMVELDLFELLPAGERTTVKVTRVRKGAPVEVKVTHGPLAEDAYIVHDYLEYNEARQEAEERRRSDAERKTRERGKRPDGTPPGDPAESAPRPNGHDPDGAWTPPGVRPVSRSSTRPDPTRPDPVPTTPPRPPSGGRRRDTDRYEQILSSWGAERFPPDRFPDCEPAAVIGYAKAAIRRGASSWDEVAVEVEKGHSPARIGAAA